MLQILRRGSTGPEVEQWQTFLRGQASDSCVVVNGTFDVQTELETKSFQFFPLRTDIVPKFIPIDTKSLIELFIDEDKNFYLLDIENKKHELWNKYFKLDKFLPNNRWSVYCKPNKNNSPF